VIVEGIEFGAVEGLPAGDLQAVFELFHLRAHLTEVRRDGGDSIRFFHSQFLRVAHFDSLVGEGRDRGQHGDFVNKFGRVCSGNCGALQGRALDLERSHHLAVNLFELGHGDVQAHVHEDVEQAGTGRIHQKFGQSQLGSWE